MYYDLPDTGCNIYQSDNFIDNYNSNIRKRYKLGENGRITLVYQTSYSSQPNGYICLGDNDVSYHSDLVFWFQVVAVVAVISIFIGILKLTRLLK